MTCHEKGRGLSAQVGLHPQRFTQSWGTISAMIRKVVVYDVSTSGGWAVIRLGPTRLRAALGCCATV